VTIEGIERTSKRVLITATAAAPQASCPRCGTMSARVHSRYQRAVADAPIGGVPVVIELAVRRMFCVAAGCPQRTFAEQVPGLTSRYARRSVVLGRMLAVVGLALAGRAGARLGARLGLLTSRSTLLRLIARLPDPPVGTVVVLGVDDFALRRGRVYGTVLIDIDTGRPVDLLPDREAATFAAWLRAHPGVQVVCRDRAGAYAEAAREGAPEAVQVADRWHLWHNLAEHVERAVARHRCCWVSDTATDPGLQTAAPAPDSGAQPDLTPETTAIPGPDGGQEPAPDQPAVPGPEPDGAPDLAQLAERAALARRDASALAVRTRQRYAAVQRLRGQGKGIKAITRELGLAKETVRRFARAATAEELLGSALGGRASVLDEFKPYLHHRFNLGHTNGSQLFAEIRAQGYRGSLGTVLGYLRPFRALAAAPAAVPVPPTVRQVAGLLLRHPDRLDADDQLLRKQVRARCPHLDEAAEHISGFAEMMSGRHGERLDTWLAQVEAADQPDLHRFAHGIRRDKAAVLNGLTLPYSSGAVEGTVNRIKMIKRQMYGRAGFNLLRKRVLLA
jgi:transposase